MCNTYNRLVIRITDRYGSIDLLEAQRLTLEEQERAAKTQLAIKGSDPAAAQVADFMEGLYFTLQSTVLTTLYDLSIAISYASLRRAPLNLDNANDDLNYASLQAKRSDLIGEISKANKV